MKISRNAVVLTAVGLVGASFVSTKAGPDDMVPVQAVFANASPLVKGNRVRAAGVDVGRITAIELRGGKAFVTMNVDRSVLPLHADSKATITTEDLLGERYVKLDRGSATAPSMGEPLTLDEKHTGRVVDLQDVLNSVDTPTAVALSSLVTEAGEGLAGNGANASRTLHELAPTMANADKLATVLAAQNDLLGHLVDSTSPVAAALATNHGRDIQAAVDGANASLSAVASERAALAGAMDRLPSTILHARMTLAELARASGPTTQTLKTLRPVTDNLGDISGELKRFSDAADPALSSLPPVLDRADELLKKAAPVAAALRPAASSLVGVAASGHRLSARALSGQSLTNLMEFVKGWSMATSDYDAISHYFKAMVPLSPNALGDDANALLPGTGAGDLLHGLPVPTSPSLPLPGRAGSTSSTVDPNSATGLSSKQEKSLVSQLLGGGLL